MSLIIFTILVILLLYFSWYNTSFALSYFLLFNNTTDMLADSAGLSFSKLAFRIVFFIIMLYNSMYYGLNKRIKLNNPVSIGVILLWFSIIYYYLELNDQHIEERALFIQNFFLFSFLPFIVSVFVLHDYKDLIQFSKGIIFWGAIFYITIYFTDSFAKVDFLDRISFAEEGKIGSIELSRLSATILITSVFTFFITKSKYTKIITIFNVLLSIFLVIAAAQRGTLIGVTIALIYYFIKNNKTIKPLYLFGFIIAIFIIIILLANTEIFTVVFDRFVDLKNVSDYERYDDYQTVMKIFSDNKYVYGLGPSGYLFATGREFPHNFILELIVEYGIFGFLSALLILFGCLRLLYFDMLRVNTFPYYFQLFISLWIVIFISVLVSGNIVSNFMYIILSYILVSNSTVKNQKI